MNNRVMAGSATGGVVCTPEISMLVRLLPERTGINDSGLFWECQTSVSISQTSRQDRWLAGLSATQMALRKSHLPFLRHDQIRAVLPQEAADTLVERLEKPCFAFHAVPALAEKGAQVFFAVYESARLAEFLEKLAGLGLNPVGVVVAELAAWPLLQQMGWLSERGCVLIVDASLEPPAIIHVVDGELQALRLVAPATIAGGDERIQSELIWLLASLGGEAERVICLGRDQAFWLPIANALTEKSEVKIPTLLELGLDVPDWAWLRPAGLALASRQGQARLLDFQDVGGFGGLMRSFLAYWRLAGLLFVLLALVWTGQEGVRYYRAQSRNQQFSQSTAALFKQALPHVPVMLEPRLQLRQALAQYASEGGQIIHMAEWIRLIQTYGDVTSEVQWLRFRYEPGEVQLLGKVPSYEHLDRLQISLKAIPMLQEVRMEEAHNVTKSNTVQFRLRLL